MGGTAPSTTTTSASSTSHYNMPNTASYGPQTNWEGPKTQSSDYHERAWTTKDHALLNLNTMEVQPVSSLELQNLNFFSDKAAQTANYAMHGGASVLRNNAKNAVHMGTDVVQGDYVGAGMSGVKLAKGSFKATKGILSQSTHLGQKVVLLI
tara:strand:+ start:89 stop:544 length:456 start_codon:yes stop_codon:yes gene_type:complete